MTKDNKAIRLLLIEESQNEAERIISLFRNAGHATRAHRVDQPEQLADALVKSWDLCIAAPCAALTAEQALAGLKQAKSDLSFIQLLDSNAVEQRTAALELGAQDALPRDEDELLLLIAQRELQSLHQRRNNQRIEDALRESEKRCQLLLDSSMDAIAYVHDGMHIYANRAYLKLFGYQSIDDLEATPLIDLIAAPDQSGFKGFMRSYSRNSTATDYSCNATTEDGKSFATRINFSPAAYDGESCVQLLIRTDQDNAELEQKLRAISSQDLVTGLFNRQRFLELLENAAQSAQKGAQTASLAYISIDQFSQLTSELGIAGIDILLADLALLLRQTLNKDSQLARIGDNVFCALLPKQTPEQHQPELETLRDKVAQRLFEIDERTAQATVSIGVAALGEHSPSGDQSLSRARRCSEKNTAGNHVLIYNPADELAASAQRGDITAMIQQALANNSFRLLFQPVISLRGDKDELYEVLLRLVNPKGEELVPSAFIEAAIEAGLAEKIDRWVLLNAIRLLAQHRAKGHQTSLFVHLSRASLYDQGLLPWLATALKAARLPADALIIQIRETDAITHLKQAKQLTEGLHNLQCQVALGQYGCAANPLNTLTHLAVDYVKVDGSFTNQLNETGNQDTLKKMLSELHAQSKQSIVPFVESASILSVLWQAGVNYIQGHYLQAPVAAMEFDFGADS